MCTASEQVALTDHEKQRVQVVISRLVDYPQLYPRTAGEEPLCRTEGPIGLLCTRRSDHEGPHAAHGTSLLCVWEEKLILWRNDGDWVRLIGGDWHVIRTAGV